MKEEIIEYGMRLGFSEIRITSADPFPEWLEAIQKRKEKDIGTAHKWEARKISANPRDLMEDAQSILVAILSYTPYKEGIQNDAGRYSAYYRSSNKGYHLIGQLAEYLETKGYKAIAHPPLPDKAVACRAGVGYFGKNGLIHQDKYGSFISLHTLLTNAPLPSDAPKAEISDCGSCRLCIEACPTAAIGEDGMVYLSRCLRDYMSSSDVIPEEIREKMGTSILGCDLCQLSCPRNWRVVKNAAHPAQEESDPFSIAGLLEESGAVLKERLKKIGELVGSNYARAARRFRSMAAIAAGNSQDPRYIPALAKTLQDPHPPIRIHSAWALGKIGGEKSSDILTKALEQEKDQEVWESIIKALESCQ